MSKLISFDPAIQDKLFRRQQIASRETPETGESVSATLGANPEVFAKTTWLRMSSLLWDGPSMMGGELHRKFDETAAAGEELTFKLKQGFSQVYSELAAEFDSPLQPYRPIPGVKSASVDYRGYFLREAKIEWVLWSLEDLERLKPYFLSIQKPVLLEWGWAYPGDDITLLDLNPYGEDMMPIRIRDGNFVAVGLSEILPKKIEENKGDYDVMLGKISNFEWTVRPDGGFDCSTRLISQASNVLSNMFPSSTSSTRYQVTKGGEINEEGKAEVNFKAYIKNLKFQLTEIPEIKNAISGSAGVGSLDFGTELDKKYKVFYSNEKVSDDEDKKEALDIGPYVTWGWMEDNIISRFVSKIETSQGGGERITGRFRSRVRVGARETEKEWKSVKITNHEELYTVDPNRFILPGQYPVSLEDPTLASTATGSYKVGSDFKKKRKIRKVYKNIDTGFAPFSVNKTDKSKGGYLRNIVIHYKLIQKAFEDSNTVEDGINYLTAELIRDFGQLWDFKITGNPDSSEECGLKDLFEPGGDLKETLDKFSTPQNTNKLYKFPAQNKDSIVKSQTMRSTVPTSMQMAVAMSANSSEGSLFSTEGTTESIIADVWGGLQKESGDISSVKLRNPTTGSFGRKDANEQKELENETGNGVNVFGIGEDDPFTKSVAELTKAQQEKAAKLEQQKETKEIVEADKWPEDEKTVGKIYYASGLMRPGYQQLMRARLYREVTGIDVAVLVPITLEVQIDGISGIKLFQHFHVDYIPEQYKTGTVFKVMDVSQQIDSSTWNTTVKGQMIATRVR
jgi:hypothetical protein